MGFLEKALENVEKEITAPYGAKRCVWGEFLKILPLWANKLALQTQHLPPRLSSVLVTQVVEGGNR